MKLFLLENYDLRTYDTTLGFIVRAKDKEAARKLASTMASFEKQDTWTNALKSSCDEIPESGTEEIILRSYLNG